MDMSQYRDLFVAEAKGHLQTLNGLVVRLEDNSGDRDTLDELFRHAHSLKGMAATMQYHPVSVLAHQAESLLSRVRGGEFTFSPALGDLLLETSDALSAMISAIEAGNEQLPDYTDLFNRLTEFTPDPLTDPLADRRASPEIHPPPIDPSGTGHQFRRSDTFNRVRVRTEILDRLVTIAGELLTAHSRMAECLDAMTGPTVEEPLAQFSYLLRDLKDEVFRARMLPFSIVSERLPRLVRDLSRRQGKLVDFRINGADMELDRGILEELSEPMVHLLRNAVDHGIEPHDERIAGGKPPGATIQITVRRLGSQIEIEVTDDGRGMDPDVLIGKALDSGMITSRQAEAMTRQEAFMLICRPGFSTAREVNDLSGRGVGMDVVRTMVRSLGGSLAIESSPGQGSRFQITLPITVSIIHVLLVESGTLTVALPLTSIIRTVELTPEDIRCHGGEYSFLIHGESIPLVPLATYLKQPGGIPHREYIPIVLTELAGNLTGIMVDRLVGQREIFVRPLGLPFSSIPGMTGGSIMGDGSILFVFDVTTVL